jgi:TPR repeat protein
MMKRMDANDTGAIYALGNWYYHGDLGLLPDREKARELLTRALDNGSSCSLGSFMMKGAIQRK